MNEEKEKKHKPKTSFSLCLKIKIKIKYCCCCYGFVVFSEFVCVKTSREREVKQREENGERVVEERRIGTDLGGVKKMMSCINMKPNFL